MCGGKKKRWGKKKEIWMKNKNKRNKGKIK